ncbi:MAG TPA: hypothetical protein VGQ83_17555 [Polyangia bacterium]|jgi:hypothetical protein
MRRSPIKLAVTAAVLLALGGLGCGRSVEEEVNDYCRARVGCGVDDTPVQQCVTDHLAPGGDAHHQCAERAKAACMGACYDDHGCGVFQVNNACGCDQADQGCPK